MTVIVGVAHKGQVWMGGDSAGVGNWTITRRSDPKVFKREGYVMGFCGSFRLGDLLHYEADLPKPPKNVTLAWMVKHFIPVIRTVTKEHGLAEVKYDVETLGGDFLVGVSGKLFYIGDDLQVGTHHDDYAATGMGHEYAEGALMATRGEEPRRRIAKALQAADRHCAGVCAPYAVRHV